MKLIDIENVNEKDPTWMITLSMLGEMKHFHEECKNIFYYENRFKLKYRDYSILEKNKIYYIWPDLSLTFLVLERIIRAILQLEKDEGRKNLDDMIKMLEEKKIITNVKELEKLYEWKKIRNTMDHGIFEKSAKEDNKDLEEYLKYIGGEIEKIQSKIYEWTGLI
jgi:hypothetical protein